MKAKTQTETRKRRKLTGIDLLNKNEYTAIAVETDPNSWLRHDVYGDYRRHTAVQASTPLELACTLWEAGLLPMGLPDTRIYVFHRNNFAGFAEREFNYSTEQFTTQWGLELGTEYTVSEYWTEADYVLETFCRLYNKGLADIERPVLEMDNYELRESDYDLDLMVFVDKSAE